MTLPGNGSIGDTGPDVQPFQQEGQGDGGSGAAGQYAGYLKGVPEQFHGQLLDGFRRTDSHWQNQLNEAQSQYAPYKAIVDRYEAPYLQASAVMMEELQRDPASVVPWLAQQFGVELGTGGNGAPPQGGAPGQQGSAWGQGQDTSDWTANVPPEVMAKLNQIDQVGQLAELSAKALLEQQQQQQLDQELAWFDQHLKGLAEKHGQFDEQWVLSRIGSGEMDPEQAVLAFHQFKQQLIAEHQQRRLPPILGAGGGTESNQVDPRKLDPSQTTNLVTQMIQAAQSQG